MKHILIFLLFIFVSCEKEQERCIIYNLVTESSENSARQKCNGVANSHPEFKVITSNFVGCLTQDEYNTARRGESVTTKQYCNGVSYTIKVTLK